MSYTYKSVHAVIYKTSEIFEYKLVQEFQSIKSVMFH